MSDEGSSLPQTRVRHVNRIEVRELVLLGHKAKISKTHLCQNEALLAYFLFKQPVCIYSAMKKRFCPLNEFTISPKCRYWAP
jgi:hypothetical protein